MFTKGYWSREKRWLLGLFTKRYWSREKRWSSRAPTASIAPPVVSRADSFRIARRQLPYRAPVVSRADSFRIARRSYRAPVVPRADSFRSAAGLLQSESLVALPSSCARRSHWNSALSASSTLVAGYSFDCPASPESRRPKCGWVSSPAPYSAGPVVSDLLY